VIDYFSQNVDNISSSKIVILSREQWEQTVPLLMWLGLSSLLQSITNSAGWQFILQGQTNRMLRWKVIGTLITVVSFGIGLPWRASSVLASYSMVWTFVTLSLILWFIGHVSLVKTKDFYVASVILALAATATALSIFWCSLNSSNAVAGDITIFTFIGTLFTLFSSKLLLQNSKRNLENLMQKDNLLCRL
jgi:O-antigen/teichoic acid export membrane protein